MTDPSTEAPSTQPTKILIAEDEAIIRLDLKEMLEEEGISVVGEAADGEAALRLAREREPDLVIMDIKMPKVDGIAAAASIVEERIAPVVMLTAFSQRDLIEQARDAHLATQDVVAERLDEVEDEIGRELFDPRDDLGHVVADHQHLGRVAARPQRGRDLLHDDIRFGIAGLQIGEDRDLHGAGMALARRIAHV